MENKRNNNVHLHGYMNEVKMYDLQDGKKSIFVEMATVEQYTNKEGKPEKKNTYHKVNLITDDKAVITKLDAIKTDLENNKKNKDTKGFKPKVHTATLDGKYITRKNTKDDKEYFNQLILTTADEFQIDAMQKKGEVRNAAEFKGNIAKIDIKEDKNFAVISIATHYYAPGNLTGEDGKPLPTVELKDEEGNAFTATRLTSFVEGRVSANRTQRNGLYENLKTGKIAVGDLVTARGQIHNNNFVDKDGKNRYKMTIDFNKMEVALKKGEKTTKEAKAEVKPAVKPATSRKKGVSM
jgi:hypothetical protein